MDSKEYMPIVGSELTQLQFVHSLYRVLKDDESLKRRMEALGIWWRYKGILAQLHNMFDVAWRTIEPEKRDRINQVWSQQELRVVNVNAPVDTSSDMMMVPKSAIMYMAHKLQVDACGMCFGGHHDRKDCEFRRAMLDLAIPDLRREEKRSGKCVGHLFDWSV